MPKKLSKIKLTPGLLNVGRPHSDIQRFRVTTKAGNTLEFFYNPENDLVVVDLTHKNCRGGNEILRKTLDEEKLVGFCKDLPENPEPLEDGDTEGLPRG